MSNYNQVVQASSAKGTSAAGTTHINRDCKGVVLSINKEPNPGEAKVSGADTILAQV